MVIARELLEQLMPFHCLLDPAAELGALIEIFGSTPARSFLEVGTHKGATSAAIAFNFPDARIVTLDLPNSLDTIWNPLPRQQVGAAHHAMGLAARIEQCFMSSSELWQFSARGDSFDMAFVDADHSCDAVFRDLMLCADLLSGPRAVLAVHDYTGPEESNRPSWTYGVQQAVDRFLCARPFRKRRLPGLLLLLEPE
jgi:predicted O-methyltransferase YrrM